MIESEKRAAPFLHEATNSGPAVLILLTSSGHAHVDYLLPCATEIKKTVKKKISTLKNIRLRGNIVSSTQMGCFGLVLIPNTSLVNVHATLYCFHLVLL